MRFDIATGYGFTDTQVDDNLITATLIYQDISYRRVYNQEADDFLLQQETSFHQTPFAIDTLSEILQSYAGNERLEKLITVLEQLFHFEIEFANITINITAILKELGNRNQAFNILGVTIRNFRPEPGISGRFTALIQDQDSALNLVEAYDGDIRDIIIQFDSKDSQVIWKLSSAGKVAVRAEEDELDAQIAIIQELILRCQDA